MPWPQKWHGTAKDLSEGGPPKRNINGSRHHLRVLAFSKGVFIPESPCGQNLCLLPPARWSGGKL